MTKILCADTSSQLCSVSIFNNDDLVDSIITGEQKDMHDLTIVDESEIQRRLRNKGFEIQCYELNKWPNTTTELRELIYET